jgi:hypothetical protein
MGYAAENIINGSILAFEYANFVEFIRITCWPHKDNNFDNHFRCLKEE